MSFTKVAFVGIGIKIDTFVQKWKKKKPFINNGKISRKINLIFIKTNFASEGWNFIIIIITFIIIFIITIVSLKLPKEVFVRFPFLL